MRNEIQKLYERLKKKHGPPAGQWKLWCKRPKTNAEKEEVIIGAILTQRTNWNNVESAVQKLKTAKMCSLRQIHALGRRGIKKLHSLIRPAGFYKMKAGYLLEIAGFFAKEGSKNSMEKPAKLPLSALREKLLALRGVGPETADSILLYALEKPVFVIDEYTRRLIEKEKITEDLRCDSLQNLFQKNLPQRFDLYQDFHALIVIEMKN